MKETRHKVSSAQEKAGEERSQEQIHGERTSKTFGHQGKTTEKERRQQCGSWPKTAKHPACGVPESRTGAWTSQTKMHVFGKRTLSPFTWN